LLTWSGAGDGLLLAFGFGLFGPIPSPTLGLAACSLPLFVVHCCVHLLPDPVGHVAGVFWCCMPGLSDDWWYGVLS